MPFRKRPRRPRRPGTSARSDVAIVAISILVPLLLFALAAVNGRGDAVRIASERAERTAMILESHALDVLDTHRMAIESVRSRIRGMDWGDRARRGDLRAYLAHLQDDLRHVATVIVTDSRGSVLASSRPDLPGPPPSLADRDWFQALARQPGDAPFVSRSYVGRLSGEAVFNVALKVVGPDGSFDGAVAISVDRSFFEGFFRAVDRTFEHSVAMVRSDGAVLSAEPPMRDPAVSGTSPLRGPMASGEAMGSYLSAAPDGIDRFYAFRKVGSWPVYVRFGLTREAALAPWRHGLAVYGVVAGVTALLLVAAAILAVVRSRRERSALVALRDEVRDREGAEEAVRQLQKMEALGQLTGGISHDFNNMLAVVVGGLDIAERRLERRGAEGIPDALRHLGSARGGADRAAALTRRLLAFSRRQALAPQVLDPAALVRNLSDLVRRTIGEAIVLEVAADGPVHAVEVDSGQLENVLVNLAVNARDAMPDGGRLRIAVGDEGDAVVVSVSDTGTGMDEDVAARAFEPFFTTKEVGKGTGLGLSQAYGFARQSGGSATLSSRPGRGTLVEIRLPRSRAAPAAASAASGGRLHAEVPGARGATVLVVEDDDRVRASTVAALGELGFTVLQAPCGDRALEILGEAGGTVDVVLTDVVMPRMTGIELAERIRSLRPALPVVFASGHANACGNEGVLPVGARLIPKPFSIDQLAVGMSEALGTVVAVPAGRRLSLVG